jgi:DNA polymerase-3 subunit delta'
MTADDLPEPDRAEGALHPRETARLHGQTAAETEFLAAHAAGRLHTGWLLTGPQGIGKATLAYRIATFLLARGQHPATDPPPATLDIPRDDPDAALIRAGSHPRLCILRRGIDDKTGKPRTQITVDEVRRLRSFFNLTAADGGRRVVILDTADEMNPNAANAILKVLEEPPTRAVLLLVSHQPSRLLPTIRSRCRILRCATLSARDLGAALAQQGIESPPAEALGELAGGSVGQAMRLIGMDGIETYATLVALLSRLPRIDRPAAIRLAESCTGRQAEPRLAHLLDLIDLFLARAARAGLMGEPTVQGAPGEAPLLARIAPHDRAARAWAALQQDLSARARQGKAVNLDPAGLILDMLWRIEDTARTTAPA